MTRYLDYYDKLKKDIMKINYTNDSEKIKNQNVQEIIDKKNKILFQKNENKIIIRDPKHSEYRFINSLFKFLL